MGNRFTRGRNIAKVMKINGETLKFKTPISVNDVIKDYPGHVLLDSESVKQFGVRATRLTSQQVLKPKKVYFLVELPKFPVDHDDDQQHRVPRRVHSSVGVNMGAKDRLELLMLSRRSVSDISVVRNSTSRGLNGPGAGRAGLDGPGPGRVGSMRVKMRLPKAQMEKLMEESRDDVDVAQKIVDLYMADSGEVNGGVYSGEIMKINKKHVHFGVEKKKEIHS